MHSSTNELPPFRGLVITVQVVGTLTGLFFGFFSTMIYGLTKGRHALVLDSSWVLVGVSILTGVGGLWAGRVWCDAMLRMTERSPGDAKPIPRCMGFGALYGMGVGLLDGLLPHVSMQILMTQFIAEGLMVGTMFGLGVGLVAGLLCGLGWGIASQA